MKNAHWNELKNLVLVAGHAVYVADNFHAPMADSSWYLQSFQKGEPPFYIEHIYEGVRLTAEDREALLVFSGGQTRTEAGPRSEALSYWMVAKHFAWWHRASVELRATTEEYAKDSFENVIFGICRFFECVGRWPEKIIVVSWAFKERRFAMHREAIRFPKDCFEFFGANNPIDLVGAEKGEANAITSFGKDPYGAGKVLAGKREERNPFQRTHPYMQSCSRLADLLRYKGPTLYNGGLPW